MTSEISDFERTRVRDDRAPASLSLARRIFPGLLAAAASAGVIIGDGWRDGTAWQPFMRLGSVIFPPRVAALLPLSVHAVIGLTLHAFLLIVWGYCFSAVARSLRGGKVFIAAVVLTGALWIITRVVFPLALGAGELTLMSSAHAVLYLVTIAIALTLGTRLARYA